MALLNAQLSTLVSQERVLDEELRRLAMQHYRALAGRSVASTAGVSKASLTVESVRTSTTSLTTCDSDYFGGLLRRLAHLRAAAASSAVSASAVTPGVASGSTPGAAASMAALDLLELPSLMETCVRSAVFGSGGGAGAGAGAGAGGGNSSASVASALAASGDDAVDLVEFACNIFASQRLLEPAVAAMRPPTEGGSTAAAPATTATVTVTTPGGRVNSVAASLLVHIIREVVSLAQELQAGLTHSLSVRAPLPVVLKAVSLLRRLARLQRKAVERSLGKGEGGEESGGGVGSAELDATQIASWLRWLFLSERDGMMTRELDAAAGDAAAPSSYTSPAPPPAAAAAASTTATATPSSTTTTTTSSSSEQKSLATRQPALLRVLELHRTLCAELISQYSAVSSSLATRSGGVGGGGGGSTTAAAAATVAAAASSAAAPLSSDALATRALLVEAVNWRCNSMMAQAAGALTRLPESSVANAQQPMAYAARRSGRFGVDYTGTLSVAWGSSVLDTVGSRLLVARRILAGADAKDERGSLALLSASLKASLDVFNSLRNAMPKALEREVLGEFLAHFHALADSPVVAEWPSAAGVFSEATQPFLDALEKVF